MMNIGDKIASLSVTAVLVWGVVALISPPAAVAIDYKISANDRKSEQRASISAPLKRARTALVEFETSPFPYDGIVPDTEAPFLDISFGLRRGHRTPRGRILWEDLTYRERRVLLHIPKGYDVARPGVMLVFFHGHRATLRRDVRDRQLVPAQVSASGVNAVLVAPQFAYNASDSSAGKFWLDGGCGRFIGEAGRRLAKLHGNAAAEAFATMPVVLVAYSGGYLPAAWCLQVGGIADRLQGVVLLDALYGELDKFVAWISSNRTRFFVSAYTNSTRTKNMMLKAMLAELEIPVAADFKQKDWRQGVTLLAAGPVVTHDDFVTEAWAANPIKDLLRRLDEYRR